MAIYRTTFLRAAIFLISLSSAAPNGSAQLNILTVREAERILDLVPTVAEAKVRGRCPSYSITDESGINLVIQVREACPQLGFVSNLLGNYIVNRDTGAVAEGLDTDDLGPQIVSPDINSVTSNLISRAHGRLLKAGEAECLALEAAPPGVGDAAGAFSATILGQWRTQWRFSVEHRVPQIPGIAVRFFSVDSDTASVRDDRTGERVISPRVALLTSRLLSILGLSTGLSVDDALAIALQVPSLANSAANGCSELLSNGDGTSDEMYIGLRTWCPGAPKTIRIVAAVNGTNGRITDPKTNKPLDSPESERLAHNIIQRDRERRIQNTASVAATCKIVN